MNCPRCRDHWQVLHSAAGWYVGTQHDGAPVCRVSGYINFKPDKPHKDKSVACQVLELMLEGTNTPRQCDENDVCPGYDEVTK